MAATKAAQLNMGYTLFPTAMLAKVPQPKSNANSSDSNARTVSNIFGHNQTRENVTAKNTGAENFIPKNGKKRYSGNNLMILGVINKIRSTFGSYVKITHELLEDELKLSHVTINQNLKQLRHDGILERKDGVSNYYIKSDIEFSERDYIPLYSFLNEKINFGGKVKKLTANAKLILCFMLRYYYSVKDKAAKNGKNNIKPEDAYFVGGKKRIASLLNVAESTANDAIWELIETECIDRRAFYIDDKCNEIICEGKGNSGAKQTVYILRTKLLRACNKVRAKMDTAKDKRTLKAKKAAQRAAKHKERADYQQHSTKARKNKNKAEQRQADFDVLRQIFDKKLKENEDEVTVKNATESPEPFEEFFQHREQPPTDKLDK